MVWKVVSSKNADWDGTALTINIGLEDSDTGAPKSLIESATTFTVYLDSGLTQDIGTVVLSAGDTIPVDKQVSLNGSTPYNSETTIYMNAADTDGGAYDKSSPISVDVPAGQGGGGTTTYDVSAYDASWSAGTLTVSIKLLENGSLVTGLPAGLVSKIFEISGKNQLGSDVSWTTNPATLTFTSSDFATNPGTIVVGGNDGGVYNYNPAYNIAVSSGGGGGAGAPCFFGNAPVLTPSGYRRMDSLREGDLVSTPNGPAVPIQRVKVYRCAAGPATNPYIIPKGQFGATKRLLISPRHRVATANGMVEAQDLDLAREERTGELTYYNLSLPGWANMIVAGVEVESLAPVQRITVPLAVFKALVAKKHGAALTPAVLAKIQSTCRFLENGMVECPVMKH